MKLILLGKIPKQLAIAIKALLVVDAGKLNL